MVAVCGKDNNVWSTGVVNIIFVESTSLERGGINNDNGGGGGNDEDDDDDADEDDVDGEKDGEGDAENMEREGDTISVEENGGEGGVKFFSCRG